MANLRTRSIGAALCFAIIGATPRAHALDVASPFEASCVRTLADGRSFLVSSCDGTCCSLEEYGADGSSCTSSCTCTFAEEKTYTVTDASYPTYIRGIPVLYQHDVTVTVPASGVVYDASVGCGATAVAELLLWYHGLGWTDLAAPYEDPATGVIEWQRLTTDLADRYLGTIFNPFGDQSPTRPIGVQRGIEAFLADAGVAAEVSHYEVTDDGGPGSIDASEAFGRIEQSVRSGRPILLGFDVDPTTGDGMIGGGGDDAGYFNHYAVIVGTDASTTPETIFVDLGYGQGIFNLGPYTCEGDHCGYAWEIGKGRVHLWFVQLDPRDKTLGSESCPTDRHDDIYAPATSTLGQQVGATIVQTEFDSFPLIHRLVRGDRCDVIGGKVTHEEPYSSYSTETTSCSETYSVYDAVLSGTWDGGGFVAPSLPGTSTGGDTSPATRDDGSEGLPSWSVPDEVHPDP